MNVYEVAHVNGDIYEWEADFFERVGDDYVFLAGAEEVGRLPWKDVMSVSKSPLRPRVEEDAEELWL